MGRHPRQGGVSLHCRHAWAALNGESRHTDRDTPT
nr:MAG TPA: hypothetical protein [Caudoviricetes sp.]